MTKIKDNHKEYNAYNKQLYNFVFFNYDNGGYIVSHKKHGVIEIHQNLIIAKILADLGERIELLEDVPNQKTPDAKRNGELWEFKTISKAKNVSRAIETALRTAKRQANNVLIYINQKHKANDIRYGIYLADKNNKLGSIRNIDVLFENGFLERIKRDEIKNGKLGEKFKRS